MTSSSHLLLIISITILVLASTAALEVRTGNLRRVKRAAGAEESSLRTLEDASYYYDDDEVADYEIYTNENDGDENEAVDYYDEEDDGELF